MTPHFLFQCFSESSAIVIVVNKITNVISIVVRMSVANNFINSFKITNNNNFIITIIMIVLCNC